MTQGMKKKRDLSLDIAKGICISLMVLCHAGCPGWLSRFVYMFHMPCFFFISGYLLSDRYLIEAKSGICKKLKGYYSPFVKWTLIFLFLHNVFTYLHIYEMSYTWQETTIRILRIITMTGGEQLLGGYWFLISLTWASIGSILILSFLHNKSLLTNIHIMGGGNFGTSYSFHRAFVTVWTSSAIWFSNLSGFGIFHEWLYVPQNRMEQK